MQTPTAPLPVLVMAGHNPGHTHNRPARGDQLPTHKALIALQGRPLVAWTIDALRASPRVGSITLAGLTQNELSAAGYLPSGALCGLPNQTSLVENGMAGLRATLAREPETEHVLVTAGDAPLLSPEAVTWFVDACAARTADLYMAIVARSVMEAAYPGSKRTYLRTSAGGFCSADLFLVRPQAMLAQEPLLRRLLGRRKRPLALVRTVGVGWLLRALLGRVHPNDLRGAAERLAGIQMRPIILPFAGAAMDVDKPFQFEIVRDALSAPPGA